MFRRWVVIGIACLVLGFAAAQKNNTDYDDVDGKFNSTIIRTEMMRMEVLLHIFQVMMSECPFVSCFADPDHLDEEPVDEWPQIILEEFPQRYPGCAERIMSTFSPDETLYNRMAVEASETAKHFIEFMKLHGMDE